MNKLIRSGLVGGLAISLVSCGATSMPVTQTHPSAAPQATIALASAAPVASSSVASNAASIASAASVPASPAVSMAPVVAHAATPVPTKPAAQPTAKPAPQPSAGLFAISAVVNGQQTGTPTRLKAGDPVLLFVGQIRNAQHATFYIVREKGQPAQKLGDADVGVPHGSADGGASLEWEVEAGHSVVWLSAAVSDNTGQTVTTKPYKLEITQPAPPELGTITTTPSEHSPNFPNDPQAVLVRSGTTVNVHVNGIKNATRMAMAVKNLSSGGDWEQIGLVQPYPDGTVSIDWTVPEDMTEALVRMSAERDGMPSAESMLHVDVAPATK